MSAVVVLLYSIGIIYPLLMIIIRALSIPSEGSAQFTLKATAEMVKQLFFHNSMLESFINTITVSGVVTAAALIIAGFLAWLVTRTDIPYKHLIEHFVLLTFMIPAFILGVSWIELLGRNGYLHRLLSFFNSGASYNFSYYSLGAVAAVLTVHLYPIVFFSLKNAFLQYDKTLENAAYLSGASKKHVLMHITIPLLVPSMLSIGLFVFSRSMANFSIPALLALPVRKKLLTTQIFSSLSALNLQEAAALSLLLVSISGLLYFLYYFIQRNRNYAGSGVSGASVKLLKLGSFKWPIFAAVMTFQCITAVLPLLSLVVSSLMKRWGLPLEWQYFTLHNYYVLFFHENLTTVSFGKAFLNSVLYGTIAATTAAAIASMTLYISHTGRGWKRSVPIALSSWPMAFPNIVLAIGAILAWNRYPFRIYGSFWVIVITYTVLFIPIIMKQMSGLLERTNPHLIQAGRISGAGPFRAFKDIILTHLLPSLKNGWMLCFLIALREIPISLMLYSSGQETLGVLLFGMQSQSYGLEMTSALAVVIIIFTFSGNWIIRRSKWRNRYVTAAYREAE